ncbi:MAG TPA: hypothetical protein IAD45_04540 [Candidatus Faecimonas intestinavium]|jgi:uncharacterized protein YukE|nr:hypothetical protein [Bacilli bacterium]HIT23666.1 hypothetical protein [Candidatus Faecimonas intestinavium]
MALNYSELTRIKGEISTNLDELTSLFSDFTNLVNENVNNQQVWYGTSSATFKNKWDEFADTKFPEYRRMFNKEIDNTMAAIQNWGRSENN